MQCRKHFTLEHQVRDSVDKIGVKGSAELWPALWDACGGKFKVGCVSDACKNTKCDRFVKCLRCKRRGCKWDLLMCNGFLVGKRRAARLAIAKGKDWSMQLHVFMSEKVNRHPGTQKPETRKGGILST